MAENYSLEKSFEGAERSYDDGVIPVLSEEFSDCNYGLMVTDKKRN